MTHVEEKLLAIAAENANLESADLLSIVDSPAWEQAERMYDWRNYVPTAIRDRWGELPLAAKLSVYVVAHSAIDQENWDGMLS